MIYDELTAERPYLKEILNLYQRLEGLKKIPVFLSGDILENEFRVSGDDAERITSLIGSAFGLNEDDLEFFRSELLSGKISIRDIPFKKQVLPALPFSQDELDVILFLVARPYLLTEKKRLNLDSLFWEEGRCPVCNGSPALSFLEKEEKRKFFCNYCGTIGPWRRTGCPFCKTETPEDISVIALEGEENMKIYACNNCRAYIKGIETELSVKYDPELLDLLSLPLDLVAQEKGFIRRAPNPVGMIKIS